MSGGPLVVTGAAGAIGREVVAAARGLGIDVVPHSGRVEGDLSAPEAAGDLLRRLRPSAVVNAAGMSYGDPGDIWRANLLVPLRLADAIARESPRTRLVLAGSAAEYGLPGHRDRIREGEPCRPNSEYGMSKLAAGRAAAAILGPGVVVARVFNVVTTPHDPRSLLGKVSADYARGDDAPRGAGDVRDFVPIAEVAHALVALALAPAPPPVVNVCSGVARTPAEVLGRTPPPGTGSWSVGDPSLLARLLGRAALPGGG